MKQTQTTAIGDAGRRRQAFSLVETMVAFAICAIVFASSAALLSVTLRGRAYTERRSAAAQIANNRLDSMRNYTYAQLVQMAETDTTLNQDGTPDPDGLFKRTTSVAPGDDWNADGLVDNYLVRVAVTFPCAIATRPYETMTASTYVMDRNNLVPYWSK